MNEQVIKELIAVGRLGGPFSSYAASQLLREASCYDGTRYWILISNFNRGDTKNIRQYLDDWRKQDHQPKKEIFKFTPGEHYHVMNTKFDSLDNAIDYLRQHGYAYAGLVEKHVYRTE